MWYNYRFKTFPALNKKINEDSVSVFELTDGLLIIVCDAVGGSSQSVKAGKICINSVSEIFKNSTEKDYLNKIRKSIESANLEVIDYAKRNRLYEGFASTVDILFLQKETAYWGHVGDSRIYKLKNKILHRMTKDHSVLQKLVDEGFITMRAASNHSGKGRIFRAVGGGEEINIDISKMHLNNKDDHKFFMCTDGVSTLISDDEIESNLKFSDVEVAVNKIESLLHSRIPTDDCTFVIVEIINQ